MFFRFPFVLAVYILVISIAVVKMLKVFSIRQQVWRFASRSSSSHLQATRRFAIREDRLFDTDTRFDYRRASKILLSDISSVKSVGPKTAETLLQLGITTVADVLFHFPSSVIEKRDVQSLLYAAEGDVITLDIQIESTKKGFNGSPHTFNCIDERGILLEVKFFCGKSVSFSEARWHQLNRVLVPGAVISVSGKLGISKFNGKWEMVNPNHFERAEKLNAVSMKQEESLDSSTIEAVYPLTQGLTNARMQTLVASCFELLNLQGIDINSDWIDPQIRLRHGWPTFMQALASIHRPTSSAFLDITSPARNRLAFDELTAHFLKRELEKTISITTENQERGSTTATSRIAVQAGVSVSGNDGGNEPSPGQISEYTVIGHGKYTKLMATALPFELTACQMNAVADIWNDMAAGKRMMRLVQGDVGSGKTIVAAMALLRAVEAGKQGAILAPTELLATQHFATLQKYFSSLGDAIKSDYFRENSGEEMVPAVPRVEIITGAITGKKRTQLLEDVRAGKINILVGTHALLTENVAQSFSSLGLVVIDEEQRFGVKQRDTIATRTNVLFTTATPIPRSMMLLLDNDYAVSTLKEKPAQKRPIQTVLLGASKTDDLIKRLGVHIPNGTKVFWVTPSLEPDANAPGVSATERYQYLNAIFPGKVALLHGKMSSEEKANVMEQFSSSESGVNILVATTVVEVGVDVPESSICVIDRAENFGLSQLHQIRGRIGRGVPPPNETLNSCFCMLVYDDKEGTLKEEEIPEKLKTLNSTSDGFEIAEADLALRGPGDFFGLKQSGSTSYRAAVLPAHASLLPDAQRMAKVLYAEYEKERYSSGGYTTTGGMVRAKQSVNAGDVYDKIRFFCDVYTSSETLLDDVTDSGGSSRSMTGDSRVSASIATKERVSKTVTALKPSKSVAIAGADIRKEILVNLCEPNGEKDKGKDKDKDVDIDSVRPLIVLLDCETSGLCTKKDRIIQLCCKVLEDDAVGIDGNVSNNNTVFSTYINPGDDFQLNPKIVEITGITREQLDREGVSFAEAWRAFTEWLTQHANGVAVDIQGTLTALSKADENESASTNKIIKQSQVKQTKPRPIVLMAHNGHSFDFNIIGHELSRHGLIGRAGGHAYGPAWGPSVNIACFIDTLAMLRDKKIWAKRWDVLGKLERERKRKNKTENKQSSSLILSAAATTTATTAIDPGSHSFSVSSNSSPVLTEPKKKRLGEIYRFVTGRELSGAHNAVVDVLALEEILQSEGFREIWREFGNNDQRML